MKSWFAPRILIIGNGGTIKHTQQISKTLFLESKKNLIQIERLVNNKTNELTVLLLRYNFQSNFKTFLKYISLPTELKGPTT